LDPQLVIEGTSALLFGKVFDIPFFRFGQLVRFDRWLLDHTGAEISFPGLLPTESEDILQVYQDHLFCDIEAFDQPLKNCGNG
jgi:hypothetical protein